jgi:hypothetical protein
LRRRHRRRWRGGGSGSGVGRSAFHKHDTSRKYCTNGEPASLAPASLLHRAMPSGWPVKPDSRPIDLRQNLADPVELASSGQF